jgi:hypothetical protein
MKFKKKLVGEAKNVKQNDKNQCQLHQKYHVDNDVMIVEKTNTIKFILKIFLNLLHLAATICIFFLSLVGIIALLLPESRLILNNQLTEACLQILRLLN